jgi:hypothetical protein
VTRMHTWMRMPSFFSFFSQRCSVDVTERGLTTYVGGCDVLGRRLLQRARTKACRCMNWSMPSR